MCTSVRAKSIVDESREFVKVGLSRKSNLICYYCFDETFINLIIQATHLCTTKKQQIKNCHAEPHNHS